MKGKRARPDEVTPELAVALAEVDLRACARDYAEVMDLLENTDPANRKAWVALSQAALNYARKLEAL